jgi:hypothetical protein
LKRTIIAGTILVLSVHAFAWDVSAGLSVSGGFFINRMTTSNSSLAVSSDLTNTSLPFRAEAYLDAQYFQIGMGYRLAVLGRQKQTQTTSGTTSTLTDADTGLKGYLALSLYAKYPFTVGQWVLFPLLGIERDVNLLVHDSNGNDLRGSMTDQQLGNETQTWVKAGVGTQLGLFSWGYVRAIFLFGWKIPNQTENDVVANAKSSPGWDATLYSLQPDLSIAVGIRL